MAKRKMEGFGFALRKRNYKIEWDDNQYVLTYGPNKGYYSSIFAMLSELISILPRTSSAGSMHEFTADIHESLESIKKLGQYIHKNFAPMSGADKDSDWGKKATDEPKEEEKHESPVSVPRKKSHKGDDII